MEGQLLFSSWQRWCYFSFLVHPHKLLGPQSHVQWVIRALYPEVNWVHFETDYSLPVSAKEMNLCRFTSYLLRVCALMFMRRDHLTLTFPKLFWCVWFTVCSYFSWQNQLVCEMVSINSWNKFIKHSDSLICWAFVSKWNYLLSQFFISNV